MDQYWKDEFKRLEHGIQTSADSIEKALESPHVDVNENVKAALQLIESRLRLLIE